MNNEIQNESSGTVLGDYAVVVVLCAIIFALVSNRYFEFF